MEINLIQTIQAITLLGISGSQRNAITNVELGSLKARLPH